MDDREKFNEYCRERRFRITFEMLNAKYDVLKKHCDSKEIPVSTFIKQAIDEKIGEKIERRIATKKYIKKACKKTSRKKNIPEDILLNNNGIIYIYVKFNQVLYVGKVDPGNSWMLRFAGHASMNEKNIVKYAEGTEYECWMKCDILNEYTHIYLTEIRDSHISQLDELNGIEEKLIKELAPVGNFNMLLPKNVSVFLTGHNGVRMPEFNLVDILKDYTKEKIYCYNRATKNYEYIAI